MLKRLLRLLKPSIHQTLVFTIPPDMPMGEFVTVEGNMDELKFVDSKGGYHKYQVFTAKLKLVGHNEDSKPDIYT